MRHKEAIHSGHFMVSDFEAEAEDEVEIALVSPPHSSPIEEDEAAASSGLQQTVADDTASAETNSSHSSKLNIDHRGGGGGGKRSFHSSSAATAAPASSVKPPEKKLRTMSAQSETVVFAPGQQTPPVPSTHPSLQQHPFPSKKSYLHHKKFTSYIQSATHIIQTSSGQGGQAQIKSR